MKSLHDRLSSFSWPWEVPQLKRDALGQIDLLQDALRRTVREANGHEAQANKLAREAAFLRDEITTERKNAMALAKRIDGMAQEALHKECLHSQQMLDSAAALKSALQDCAILEERCAGLLAGPNGDQSKETVMAKKAPPPAPMPAGKGKGKKGC